MTESGEIRKPPIVPAEYTAKWIAWNQDRTRIVASGDTYQQAWDAAVASGESEPILAKAPRSDVRYVGGNRWPKGFFEKICIGDPAFSRPPQGPMPPAPSLD